MTSPSPRTRRRPASRRKCVLGPRPDKAPAGPGPGWVTPETRSVAIVTIIPIAAAVPTVIVFHAAVLSLPVTVVVPPAFVTRADPSGSPIRRASPVTGMPSVVVSHRIPITLDPCEVRTGGPRPHGHHPGWGRRTDLDSDSDLGENRSGREERESE